MLNALARLVVTRRAAVLPIVAGLWALLLSALSQHVELTSVPDFVVFWTAGRALMHGNNVYDAALALNNGYPFFYPLPSAMIMAPFGLLPWPTALLLFAGLGGSLLAIASLHYGRGLAPALLSASFLNAVVEGQWSPLLVSAAVVPWLHPFLIAKPSIGLALWAFRPSRNAVLGGSVLVALSLAIQPDWPLAWVGSLQATNHVAPVVRPWGFILLLALLRWRTPEGRLLGVLACVPHTAGMFETLPLFLVPRTRLQGYTLCLLSFAALIVKEYTLQGVTLEERIGSGWPALFAFLWLPTLAMVLLQRASESPPAVAPSPPVRHQPAS